MGLLDLLRGKPPQARSDEMAALADAKGALEQEGLRFAGKAGLCYKASDNCRETIRKAASYPRSSGIATPARMADDAYGCTWAVLEDENIDSIITSARAAFDAFASAGCGPEFLCSVFAYEKDGKKVYLIYNKLGKFYPFAPEGEKRDSHLEIILKRQLEGRLPMEGALSQWYPLWGMPI